MEEHSQKVKTQEKLIRVGACHPQQLAHGRVVAVARAGASAERKRENHA